MGVDTGTLGHRCADDQDGVKADTEQELRQKLKNYMMGFMMDPTRTDGLGRAAWPNTEGRTDVTLIAEDGPGAAWDSPLAHRKFFEWRAGGPTGVVDADRMRSLLEDIGMDQTICGTSVADGIIHSMDKGGDDGRVTWPEYLNSMFHIGPVSDSMAPDPTEASSEIPFYVTLPLAPVDGPKGPLGSFTRFDSGRDPLGGRAAVMSTSHTGWWVGLGVAVLAVGTWMVLR